MPPVSPAERPLRLVLAARLSHKLRDGERGIGIETQDEYGRAWAEREGHTIVAIAADTRSGRIPPWDRPNLRPWVACGCDWCREQDTQSGRFRRPATTRRR